MPELILYHMPRACGFVSINAMEEAGLSYELRAVNIMQGEQKDPDYMKLHPGGKVPLLLVDGKPLTENAAILSFLHALAPDAGLLGNNSTVFSKAKALADLVWCSSTFHPTARMLRMPVHFTDEDPAPVQAKGSETFQTILDQNEERFSAQDWWRADAWSIVDVYVFWCTVTGASTGLVPMDRYPAIGAHMQRVMDRPSFARAAARQDELQKGAGIVFPN